MGDKTFCNACLSTEGKMHNIDLKIMTRSAREIIATISQIPETKEPGRICNECINFLYKYEKFRDQCAQASMKVADGDIVQITSPNQENSDEASQSENESVKVEYYSDNESDQDGHYTDNSSQEILEYNFNTKKDDSGNEDNDNEDSGKEDIGVNYNDKIDITIEMNNENLNMFSEYLTIVEVDADEARKQLLARTKSANYMKSPFKCDFCFRGYPLKNTFENHIKKHSSASGKYECEICQLRFNTEQSCYKHYQECHRYKITCKLCPYFGYSLKQARKHIEHQHQGKKYECNECCKVFSTPACLQSHKRLEHVVNWREEACAFCGLTFVTAAGLHLHRIKLHKQEKNEKKGPFCKECKIQFSTMEAWQRHLKISSKHNTYHGCAQCGESFGSAAESDSHKRTRHYRHEAGWVADKRLYRRHMARPEAAGRESADKKPYVCEHCGLAFRLKCFLRYHLAKHSGERPYRCDQCPMTFQQPQQYYGHRAMHRHKPQCTICGRVYKYLYGLSKHMRMHLGIRPHQCTFCDKTFINKCDVKLHIKHVHEKQPWPKRVRKRPKSDKARRRTKKVLQEETTVDDPSIIKTEELSN